MNALQKTLAIIAFLILITQTVRHAYRLWLEPRVSVLDKYEQPLKSQIADAASLAELVRRYDPVRKETDKARREREELLKTTKEAPYLNEATAEPYKSEAMLREAIIDWEQKSKQIREVRCYWSAGMALFLLGLFIYRRSSRWLGFTLMIAGFSEIIYWTSPTFLVLGGATREFDRLLVNKFAFSVVSLVALTAAIWFLSIFVDKGAKEQPES